MRVLRSANVSFAYLGSSLIDIRYLDTSMVIIAMASVSENLETANVGLETYSGKKLLLLSAEARTSACTE